MRRRDFAPNAPGELVELGDGVAFVPDHLPPDLVASWTVHEVDARARGALGEFVGQARLVKNPLLVIRPLLTIEAVESVRLEGTQTHVHGVLFQQAGARGLDAQERLDHLEAIRYVEAVRQGVEALADGRPLTLQFIRALHAELLRETRGADRKPGEFRKGYVIIGRRGDTAGTARFVPPPPERLPELLQAYGNYLQQEPPFSPLISAAAAHYHFEAIHPFEDGNGRLGRLLITLYLMTRGVLDQPLLYLSEFFNARRDEYLDRLLRMSTEADWEGWLLFFLQAVETQSHLSSARVLRMLELQEVYRELLRERSPRSGAPLAALDLVMRNAVVSVPEVRDFLGSNYRTARRALDALEAVGIVEQQPDSYPRLWSARELLRSVYAATPEPRGQ